jgi:hypothetical protein
MRRVEMRAAGPSFAMRTAAAAFRLPAPAAMTPAWGMNEAVP